jgi:hypothetical protein
MGQKHQPNEFVLKEAVPLMKLIEPSTRKWPSFVCLFVFVAMWHAAAYGAKQA